MDSLQATPASSQSLCREAQSTFPWPSLDRSDRSSREACHSRQMGTASRYRSLHAFAGGRPVTGPRLPKEEKWYTFLTIWCARCRLTPYKSATCCRVQPRSRSSRMAACRCSARERKVSTPAFYTSFPAMSSGLARLYTTAICDRSTSSGS